MLITENRLDEWVRANAVSAQGVIVELRDASNGGNIKAVFHLYLVRENLRSETEAEVAIFHEVYDHYGQAKLFSNRILAEMTSARGRPLVSTRRTASRLNSVVNLIPRPIEHLLFQ